MLPHSIKYTKKSSREILDFSFEKSYPNKGFADVAQLVEQRIRNA